MELRGIEPRSGSALVSSSTCVSGLRAGSVPSGGARSTTPPYVARATARILARAEPGNDGRFPTWRLGSFRKISP